MSQSIRVFYGTELNLHGRCRMNFNWPPITAVSIVSITAFEAMEWGSAALIGGQSYIPNLGEANVWVSNVSPHQGGVEFILNVDWKDPLNVAVTISVDNDALDHFRVTA